MDKAGAVSLRRAAEMANTLVKMGIDFVPIPVKSDTDKAALIADLMRRLDELEAEDDGRNADCDILG